MTKNDWSICIVGISVILLATLAVSIRCNVDDGRLACGRPMMTNRLKQAIEEARAGELFWRSTLFEAVLSPEEVSTAKGYVLLHPDISSYSLLMALRQQAPKVYSEIPGATKADILCGALAPKQATRG